MNYNTLAQEIVDWMQTKLQEAGTRGFVIGLSGGIDSATTAALCRRAAPGKVLGVCDADLCTPILTFVFGVAQVAGRCAVISLHRLHQEVYGLPPDPALLLQRSAKEAIHELGHTCGLRHCIRYDCVMHSSESVEQADLKRLTFCPGCTSKLAELDRSP